MNKIFHFKSSSSYLETQFRLSVTLMISYSVLILKENYLTFIVKLLNYSNFLLKIDNMIFKLKLIRASDKNHFIVRYQVFRRKLKLTDFQFLYQKIYHKNISIKRQVLSIIAEIFNPPNSIGPFIVTGKLHISLNEVLLSDWNMFFNIIEYLSNVKYPRYQFLNEELNSMKFSKV